MGDPTDQNFKWRDVPSLMVETYREWIADEPFRLSAIVAYYAVLSLPALLVIIINIVGSIWGTEVVQGEMNEEFTAALGADTAEAIANMIAEAGNEKKNTISTIIGIATLLYGATGVFYQLKISLNQIWAIKPDPNAAVKKIVIDRARSFAFILVIGFLLLISFVMTTAVSALSSFITSNFPDFLVYLAYAIDTIVSIGIITLLFALMFKYLPDVKIKWEILWKGAFLTALLFIIGKSLLSLYFSQMEPGSTYGAAGSIVLILLWASYSCLILFFGAEFTYVYAKRYSNGIKPSSIGTKDNENKGD
ncbi:YihY/virulence factor BrkB family protein [Pricia sp. S334]|uniref:YihY/virulence factor BrkB family protein n=1 Tax=Pricia mediterranea TaxID=3076079 RepID=A0ABU3L128_9FLAO|nr:YihY/virulence factor BrkB family protein [Pricia sp. S334]MDT7827429.1 YihY/virulence factor BrkB family protein [Pricia sp. S334]